MPRLSILSRRQALNFLEPGRPEEVAEVTYVSDAYGVRSVFLPLESYRAATSEEVALTPRYELLPASAAARQNEATALAEDLRRAAGGPPETLEL